MRAITYGGELVAIATRGRVHLAPEVAALPHGDPKLRFVAALCLYSRDVDSGELEGPYRADDAEVYARCVLLPDETFEAYLHEPDGQLAERFRVPVEQVAAQRVDIEASAGCGRALQPRDLDEEKEGTRFRTPGPIRGERRRDERNQPNSPDRRPDT